MYSKIVSKAADASFFKRWLFKYALKRGVTQTHSPEGLADAKSFDGLVWAKIRERLGFDRLQVLLSGGAPCPTHIMEFLRVLLRAEILQGYGLTETFAVVSLSDGADPNLGHTGLPIGCEVRLEAVPDTDYHPDGEEKRGEILVRGNNLFSGYFRDETRTREAMKDGWFHTGDVGRFNPNGTLSVVDRKKALFKLSQGEYISPEVLEASYSRAPCVNQIFVYGDSKQPFVVAVVVPDVKWVLEHFNDTEELSKKFENNEMQKFLPEFSSFCQKQKEAIITSISNNLKDYEEDLRGFERVKGIVLEPNLDFSLNGFTPENELLTPSFKLRRVYLVKRYKQDLERVYEQIG